MPGLDFHIILNRLKCIKHSRTSELCYISSNKTATISKEAKLVWLETAYPFFGSFLNTNEQAERQACVSHLINTLQLSSHRQSPNGSLSSLTKHISTLSASLCSLPSAAIIRSKKSPLLLSSFHQHRSSIHYQSHTQCKMASTCTLYQSSNMTAGRYY